MEIVKNRATIQSVDDWYRHAPPKGQEKQWKAGRSALECAEAWCGGDAGPCVPDEIASLLSSHRHTQGTEILSGIPEHQVRFDKLRGEPRNTDLALIGRNKEGIVAISIEAKADEPFDRSVQEIVADTIDELAHGGRSKVNIRIETLAGSLLPPREGRGPRLGDLKYQLLTATAGALAYAASVDAKCAVLIIHEFISSGASPEKQRANSQDLTAFVNRLSGGSVRELKPGELIGPIKVPGKPLFEKPGRLYIGKACRTLGAGSPP